MQRFLLITILTLSNFVCFSQKNKEVPFVLPNVDSLRYYSNVMYNGENDILKYEANERFKSLLMSNLQNKDSHTWNFDTIQILSVQSAKDLSFRIFTWCMPLNSGKFEHFGYLMLYSKKSGTYNIEELDDVSGKIEFPEKESLKNNKWYGAVYYQIIENRYHGDKFYTLIGWNGWNSLTQKKIIDIIYFNSRGDAVFGKNVFRGKGYSNKKRLIFEYGDQIVMKLRYEFHDYKIITKKEYKRNSRINKNNDEALKAEKKKTIEKVKTEPMIVFDELTPIRKELEGQFEFYYPLSAKTNSFHFDDGKWCYRELNTKDEVEKNTKNIRYGLKQQ